MIDVEPTAAKTRVLPDGRVMAESKIVVSPEAAEKMWKGYMCARCLEDVSHLGPYPDECPLCHFPMKAEQRRQLEQDFVGEHASPGGFMDREREAMLRAHHEPKPQILVSKSVRDRK